MSNPRVLSVGQCWMDGPRIGKFLRDSFGAEVVKASTSDEALAILRAGDIRLVLVNRIFDADGYPGLDLIRTIRDDPATAEVPTMLVSNYPESQAEAVALGALPGFGKAELGKAKARQALEPVFKLAGAKSS